MHWCVRVSPVCRAVPWRAAAEGYLSSAPDELLVRVVRQMQQLFEVPRLEGMLTAMHKVYVTFTEQRNCIKSLSGLLSLPADAGG